jgi:hypothetical protein
MIWNEKKQKRNVTLPQWNLEERTVKRGELRVLSSNLSAEFWDHSDLEIFAMTHWFGSIHPFFFSGLLHLRSFFFSDLHALLWSVLEFVTLRNELALELQQLRDSCSMMNFWELLLIFDRTRLNLGFVMMRNWIRWCLFLWNFELWLDDDSYWWWMLVNQWWMVMISGKFDELGFEHSRVFLNVLEFLVIFCGIWFVEGRERNVKSVFAEL